jgi:hypothetical protein
MNVQVSRPLEASQRQPCQEPCTREATLAPPHLDSSADLYVPNPLKRPLMHLAGQHPTRRTAAFAIQRLDHHLADAQRAVDRLNDAVSGQVEKHARSITLRARRLDHGSWSFFD